MPAPLWWCEIKILFVQVSPSWAYGPPVKHEKIGSAGFPACAGDSRGRLSSMPSGTFPKTGLQEDTANPELRHFRPKTIF
jgi:hypothetical protein